MICPTVEKLLDIQTSIILNSDLPEDEGMEGKLRDIGTLEYIVDERNWKENLFDHASWLFYKIATQHPFFQGNKRTAVAVAENVLAYGNLQISASEEMIRDFTIRVATFDTSINGYGLNVEDVEKWLLNNVEEIKK